MNSRGRVDPEASTTEAARRRILLALDVADLDAARRLVQATGPHVGGVKIGKELFTRCGPEAIGAMGSLPVFLDLKFHDIPNTVARAVGAAAEHGVRWLTLHTAGGAAMLEAAAQARDALPAARRPLLLGVTVLTSLPLTDPEEVVDRALLAQECGLDGAIASPREVRTLRTVLRPDFLLVTPGVRPAGAAANDQSRVASPYEAIRDGADYLVIGRPIHAAADPGRAAAELVQEIVRGLQERRGGEAAVTREAGSGSSSDAGAGMSRDGVAGVSRAGAVPHEETSRDVRARRLLGMLRESQAFLEGHFILTSGLHSDRYVQCAQLLQYPEKARRAGLWLAERLRPHAPDVVLSPALGGVVIGQEVAAALGVRSLFAERDATGALQMRRGFSLRPGERVAIVDDVCTRGGSIAECEQVVQAQGGTAVVAGAIIDRSGGERAFQLPFESLLTVQAKAQRPEECPLCAAGSPAVKPGSRRT